MRRFTCTIVPFFAAQGMLDAPAPAGDPVVCAFMGVVVLAYVGVLAQLLANVFSRVLAREFREIFIGQFVIQNWF